MIFSLLTLKLSQSWSNKSLIVNINTIQAAYARTAGEELGWISWTLPKDDDTLSPVRTLKICIQMTFHSDRDDFFAVTILISLLNTIVASETNVNQTSVLSPHLCLGLKACTPRLNAIHSLIAGPCRWRAQHGQLWLAVSMINWWLEDWIGTRREPVHVNLE